MIEPAVLLALPVLAPLVCAFLGVLARRARSIDALLGLAGPTVVVFAGGALVHANVVGGVQVLAVGGWPAPFSIVLVGDLLAALLVAITGVVGLACAVYSLVTIDESDRAHSYFPMTNVLVGGVAGAFCSGDVFNLYVWFEVMLIASFVLLAQGGRRAQLEGALTYVVLNLLSSTLFLAAAGSLYGMTGGLSIAHVAVILQSSSEPREATVIAMLFLIAFGIKAAMFPLFFWLPASYHAPPPAVSALFAGLLTKVGVYAMLRMFTVVFVHDVERTHGVLLVAALLTMIVGVLGALGQSEVRRILSFHVVSQIGYMLLGVALHTREAIAAAIFYVLHHILVKTNLFLVAGVIRSACGTERLPALGDLQRARPWLALAFLLAAGSLAGVPPLSGFWAKLALLRAALDVDHAAAAVLLLVVGLFTTMSMLKIWEHAFWRPLPDAEPAPRARPTRVAVVAPIALLTVLSLLVALCAEPLYELCLRAADQTFGRAPYLRAVLGSRP